jgi:signal peptidase I
VSKSFVKNVGWFSGITGAVILLLYLFVFDTWVVPADDAPLAISVLPLLKPHDRILVRRGAVPQRNELARCASPEPGQQYVLGRVVAIGGERVEITNERAVVNGAGEKSRFGCQRLSMLHPVTQSEQTLACTTIETGASTSYDVLTSIEYPEGQRSALIEPGKLYILSDNRHLHKDSRDFGQVDASTCERISFRLWGESFMDGSRRFNLIW